MVDEKKPDDRGAVLQMEIDVGRFVGVASADFSSNFSGETAWNRIFHIATTAARDTIRNGGTLVIVRSVNTVTIVQRPQAEPLDA